jgi:uncharacterized membrane protein
MSDRVSGHPRRSHLAVRAALLLASLGLVAGPLAPLAAAADELTLTTPFPSIVAEPGSTASFKLTVDSVNVAGEVKLKADGVPAGWTARFAGGGLTVDSAYVLPAKPVEVTLNLEIPAEATAGSSTLRVSADLAGIATTLPLTVRVADAAAGDVTLTSDFPELKGPSSSTFTFNLTLKNGTATEGTFALDAQGAPGWTVSAKPSGQAQATSIVVAAGGTSTITVTAEPPAQVDAASYPVQVTVTGGGKTVQGTLKVTITGTYTLDLSTANQVLSTSANAGTRTDFPMTITNSGTAPLTQVTPTATAPTKWTVAFDPPTIDSIAPGESATVTAQITPTSDAISGDYNVSVTAKAAEASGDVTIRVKVETPAFWWIAGIALIAAVFAGLYWVFRTYGRR